MEKTGRDRDRDFKEIVHQYINLVYSISYRILGNGDDAGDAVQETFFKVHRNLDKYKKEMSFKNWLYAIAINTSKDVYRKRRRHRDDVALKEEGISDKGGSIKDMEDRVFTQELLNGLQMDYRIVMTLFYLEGKNIREISKILKIPQVLVKVRLHRARKKILDKFGKRV